MSSACHHTKMQLRIFFTTMHPTLGEDLFTAIYLGPCIHISVLDHGWGSALFFVCSLVSFAADSRASSCGGDRRFN
jgi:hypothetical protein